MGLSLESRTNTIIHRDQTFPCGISLFETTSATMKMFPSKHTTVANQVCMIYIIPMLFLPFFFFVLGDERYVTNDQVITQGRHFPPSQ